MKHSYVVFMLLINVVLFLLINETIIFCIMLLINEKYVIFMLLINVKMPTIVGIFSIYEQDKLHAYLI